MMEDAAKLNLEQGGDADNIRKVTNFSNLPLKSPKRLIALQLANSNPAFR